ncbi:MAG: acyl-CoA mutase large subunit family protein, partial [Beijerinckiaceae bacterium]|nr:acyl-CoA mutase large subunit family protein [Beijerinckiaceae bacterium]
GAGSFEALTSGLCTRAWELFQSFEAKGGMFAALRAGLPQTEISAAAEARREAIAQRKLLLTGTSAFPLVSGAQVNVLAPAAPEDPENALENDRACLRPRRDAAPFEALRMAVDEYSWKTGERPRIFLANLGSLPGDAAASAFAANFFAIAGIDAVSGEAFEDIPAAADVFRASGCKIVCICAPEGTVPQTLIEAWRALTLAGASRIYLTGGGRAEAVIAPPQLMVNEFNWTDRSALAILQDATATVLGKQLS